MYFFKIDTKKVLFCVISLIFLCALEVEKNASYFTLHKEEAEKLLSEQCLSDIEAENKICQAAEEGLKKLKEAEEKQAIIKEVFEQPIEENPPDTQEESLSFDDYRKLFKKFPNKLEEVMDSKCDELFSNPQYDEDTSLHDIECDAAKEELEEIEKSKNNQKITDSNVEKNLEYFKSNIIEAKKTDTSCKTKKIDPVICQYVSVALKEHEEIKEKKLSLEEFYRGNILAARDTVTKCQEKIETDSTKCETAFKIYNENVSKNRNQLEFEKHLNFFRNNLTEAQRLLKTKCKGFSPKNSASIFIENDECQAVQAAINEQKIKNDKIELLKLLSKYKEQFIKNISDTNSFNSKKYQSLTDYFSKEHKLAEDFMVSCIENKTRAKVSALDCLAALNVIAELLESAQRLEEEREKAKKEYKNYYRKYFAENPDKAQDLLAGRCKLVFANQWYEYDENIKDEECEAARTEQKRLNRIKKEQELEKLNALKKDEKYYIDNIEMTRSLKNECVKGTVYSLHDCEMSLKVLKKISKDKKKIQKYKQHYKSHILEAKYKLKWCKSNMIKFDTHCQVVSDILANHTDKILDEEKYKEKLELFEQNPLEANIIYIGKCKELITNNWYFLDINMQTEECNAAYEVIKAFAD